MAGTDDQPERYGTAYAGSCGSVKFAHVSNGTQHAKDFWDGLTIQQKAAFGTLFRMIASNPSLQLTNRQKFKQIEGDLCEFKSNTHQMRIFCFRRGSCWYLTSGMDGKNEDELPPGVVKRALEIMEDCAAELIRSEAGKSKVRRPYK